MLMMMVLVCLSSVWNRFLSCVFVCFCEGRVMGWVWVLCVILCIFMVVKLVCRIVVRVVCGLVCVCCVWGWSDGLVWWVFE